ncbi:inactive ubiquitin carboxyl-terminal hydrolase MINDY-4B-like [Papilio machaon]|uniref:inactive ubiquitin carboxyl-terminal hydrolase MINDY-4B-like n=1 Tax=Papilio machaon TaxID=76193 RepID=UPI001E664705|nr:inactive ubiquitin carboxyl-terminal hydrolase MINDY-4B-like [Papilio machaon]
MSTQERGERSAIDKNDKKLILMSPDLGRSYEENFFLFSERALYLRNKLLLTNKSTVAGGRIITEELAIELRVTIFGTAACPPRGEWIRSPLLMRPPDLPFAYGLMGPRNSTRSLLTGLQAYIIKWILFDSRPPSMNKKSAEPPESHLRISEALQEEVLWRVCSDVIWRCGAQSGSDNKAVVALPTDTTYVYNNLKYYQDGVTEKLQLFELKNLEELQIFLKRYLYIFQGDGGALLLLYAMVLTRGCANIKKDLDGKLNYLLSAQPEGSLNLTMLVITGRATPYLHNGIVYDGDEDNYALPQFGVLSRSPVGFLLWQEGLDNRLSVLTKQLPGSRLKTPAFPIWITNSSGHFGVLFNTNRELLKNYQAEKRFDIHYYTCGGCYVALNVDTRVESQVTVCKDDLHTTTLEKLIHTKWQDATITWSVTNSKIDDSS